MAKLWLKHQTNAELSYLFLDQIRDMHCLTCLLRSPGGSERERQLR
jgi:hypothetical protein